MKICCAISSWSLVRSDWSSTCHQHRQAFIIIVVVLAKKNAVSYSWRLLCRFLLYNSRDNDNNESERIDKIKNLEILSFIVASHKSSIHCRSRRRFMDRMIENEKKEISTHSDDSSCYIWLDLAETESSRRSRRGGSCESREPHVIAFWFNLTSFLSSSKRHKSIVWSKRARNSHSLTEL